MTISACESNILLLQKKKGIYSLELLLKKKYYRVKSHKFLILKRLPDFPDKNFIIFPDFQRYFEFLRIFVVIWQPLLI